VQKWCSHFGCTAVAMVNTFFDSDDVVDTYATDDARVGFAEHMLNKLRFLYQDTEDENPKVRPSLFYT
jgi:hypothetical protein